MQYLGYYKNGIMAAEILVAIFGFFNWKKIQNSYWKTLPFFLILMAFCEILYKIGFKQTLISMITTIIVVIQFNYFLWLFYKNGVGKKLIIICGSIFISTLIMELIYKIDNGKFYFNSISYSIGNIILLIVIFNYFLKLTNSNEIIHFYKKPFFWISLGILIYNLGSFPYYLFYNLLKKSYFSVLVAYTWIEVSLLYLMYALFAKSFLLFKNDEK